MFKKARAGAGTLGYPLSDLPVVLSALTARQGGLDVEPFPPKGDAKVRTFFELLLPTEILAEQKISPS